MTFLHLTVAIVAVSLSAIFIRLTNTQPLVIAFYRQLFSAMLLLPFYQNSPREVLSNRSRLLLALSGLFLALHFATWITGLRYTTVARATLFVDLQPVWSAILGLILLKEKMSPIEVAAVGLVTFGGMVTMGGSWSAGKAGLLGDSLAIIGGVAGACYFLIGRSVRAKISWLHYMFFVYALSAAWILLFHVCLFRSFPLPVEKDLAWIFLMALIPSLLGHGLFNLVIRKVKAFVVNSAFLGEPVLATIWAYILFEERPDLFYYAGAGLIFTGLFMLFRKQTEEPVTAPPENREIDRMKG